MLRRLVGLGLFGYGLLILLDVLAHDDVVAGWLSLVLGAALAISSLRQPTVAAALDARLERRLTSWSIGVGVLGTAIVAATLTYNHVLQSPLSLPEIGLVAYGTLLLAAAPFLGRRVASVQVASAVAWSFPLLLAPLAMFALNGLLTSDEGTALAAASPVVRYVLVLPTAAVLALLGLDVTVSGTNILLATDEGTLSLNVGLVCAGLYPMVLFGGMVGLHAWNERLALRQTAKLVALGLACLWFLNVVRLATVAAVGRRWGPEAMVEVHAQIGWILFALFSLAFWAVVLRRQRTVQPLRPGVPRQEPLSAEPADEVWR